MTILDNYFLGHQIPVGVRSAVRRAFDDSIDPKLSLTALREYLEQVLFNLSGIFGITVREIGAQIEKLRSAGGIDREVSPYFHLWWDLSSLGSHFQPESDTKLGWNRHLDLCRRAAALALLWYVKKYPPICLTEREKYGWIANMARALAVDKIQVCVPEALDDFTEHGAVLVLEGLPWVGKTSIAIKITKDLIDRGFIPIVAHENSLLTFGPGTDESEGSSNVRFSNRSSDLHQLVLSRLLHGDSFVVFLDDPFGHRRFIEENSLTLLRIKEWADAAKKGRSLGQIRVVITSPTQFLTRAINILSSQSSSNPISMENLALLQSAKRVVIQPSLYTDDQLKVIVSSAAKFHSCTWAGDMEYCDLLAETVRNERLTFDAVHVFCQQVKSANDDDFLEKLVQFSRSPSFYDEIGKLGKPDQIRLAATLVGESLNSYYHDYFFQSELTFTDIVRLGAGSAEASQVSEWWMANPNQSVGAAKFPRFLHPEIREAVLIATETNLREPLRQIVFGLCGLEESQGPTLAKWEAIHLALRFGALLSTDAAQQLHREFMERKVAFGGDPRNVLWAIVENIKYLRSTPAEDIVNHFVKQIRSNYRWLIRPLIWEVTTNWLSVSEVLRKEVVSIVVNSSQDDPLRPSMDNENALAFLAAGVTHYSLLQQCARAGDEDSEMYIKFLGALVGVLGKDKRGLYYLSRRGDGLFDDPGSQYSAYAVLERLLSLGLRTGSFNDAHPFALQINAYLRALSSERN